MIIRENLFKKGIDPKTITSERQLDNILNTPHVAPTVKPKKPGEVIEVDFGNFPEKKAYGGLAGMLGERTGYENGLKVTDDDFYLGDPGFLRELPDPYKDLPEEERKMRKEMDEIMRKRFYKDPYEGMSEEEIEFIKNQLKIREQQRKDRGLPEGIQLLNKGGLAHVLGV